MTDEEQLRRVLARFVQLRDDKRFDEWVECFHEDGVFEYGQHRLVGRRAIRDHVARLLADITRSPPTRCDPTSSTWP